ncbi:UNKNOWN [Stylonychia lemnae]|uniref:Kelch motif family protein n=1 Tax=Stylonychia lemnae TaxID=5949 RepID=A0A078A9D6_STYLE|nr:UNKNOWN [Stylonychia lemnae]|eukprot:CDW78834.1 UNKNOWN [Stylonychia lemnae]
MNKSIDVARRSQAFFVILQYLRPGLRTRLQLLCKHFYNKIIPQMVQTFPILKTNKDDYFELFKDQQVIRINQSQSQTILHQQTIRQLLNTNLDPLQQVVQQWKDTKLDVPAGFQFEKMIFVNYQCYLFNSTASAMKVYKLINNKVILASETKLSNAIHSCYVTVQNRYILRIGGYQNLVDEKKSKQLVITPKNVHKCSTSYDSNIYAFDILTNEWITSNKFGKLSKIRHGCSASVHKNFIYVFGGSYFIQSGPRMNTQSHQSTIEKQDLLNPGKVFQVIDFKMKIPMQTLYSSQNLHSDDFFIFGQIESKASAYKSKQSKLDFNFYRYNVTTHKYKKKDQDHVVHKILDSIQSQGLEKLKQNTNFQDIRSFNGIHVITNDFGAIVYQDQEIFHHQYILSWKVGQDAMKQPDAPKPKQLKPSVNNSLIVNSQNLKKRPQTAYPIQKPTLAQRAQSAVTRPVVSRRLALANINQR